MSLLTRTFESSDAPVIVGMTDPFLYNPRRQATSQVASQSHYTYVLMLSIITFKGATLLVQNEPFDVVLTLRNPFVFELELINLSLRSELFNLR